MIFELCMVQSGEEKKTCSRRLLQRWEAEMAEAGSFQRVADSSLQFWRTAMPAGHESSSMVSSASSICPQLLMATQPRRLVILLFLPSCVCVHGANLRPCLVHIWHVLCDTECFWRAVRLQLLFVGWSFIQQLSFILMWSSWNPTHTSPKLVIDWKKHTTENVTQIHLKKYFS